MKHTLLLLALAATSACSADGNSVTAPSPQYAGNSKPTNSTPTFYLSNAAAYGLRGDGVAAFVEPASSPYAGTSRYKHGECGGDNVFYTLPGYSGDAIMGTGSSRNCSHLVRIAYELINPDGSTTSEGSITVGTFLNVRQVQKAAHAGNPAIFVPVGATEPRTMAFSDDEFKCGEAGMAAIAFVPVLFDGTVTGADMVQVYRSAGDTWVVSTVPDEIDGVTGQTIHHDKAYCRGNGKLYHMPVSFTIKTSVPLTP